MKSKSLIWVVAGVLLLCLCVSGVNAVCSPGICNTNTGFNFATIQAAIDDPGTLDGHTITVDSGIYTPFIVNKRLTILGIDTGSGLPLVTGGSSFHLIDIRADYVTLDFFKVLPGTGSAYGVYIDSSHNVLKNIASNNHYSGFFIASGRSDNTLYKCSAVANTLGIFFSGSHDNIVKECTVTNSLSSGIHVANSYNNVIKDSFTALNRDEIYLFADSPGNDIHGNTLINGMGYGVYLGSSNNVVYSNTITNNNFGIYLPNSNDNKVYDNHFNNIIGNVGASGTGNAWNTPLTAGTNIIGGSFLGGNYWANPSGTGFSQTCSNRGDGICDSAYTVAPGHIDNLPLTNNPVPPPPVAAFIGTPTSGKKPLAVTFTDESEGNPTGRAWYFGDEDYAATWTPQTSSAEWTARGYSSSVAMPDGSIVLMGGSIGVSSSVMNDVWQSTDNGATWTLRTASPGWSARYGHTSVVKPDGTIVLMGGYDNVGMGNKNDVWQSTDNGATWTLRTASPGWSPRYWHSSVVKPDGTIVLMGGFDGSEVNDVWQSTDNGATWTQVKPNDAYGWTARHGHKSVAMPDGSIVLMGGVDGSGWQNDVWRSTDNGATWTRVNAGDAAWGSPSCVVMPDGSIVMTGGVGSDDVWRSTDNGATWTQVNANAGWPARSGHTSVVMPDGNIVLMGGFDAGVPKNDVWRLQPSGSSAPNPSHTYNTPGTYQVALQAYNGGGYSSIRKTGYIKVTAVTQGEAVTIGKNKFTSGGGSLEGKGLSVSQNSLSAGTRVQTMRGSSASPNKESWLVSINHNPKANLESLFTNIYVYDENEVSSEEVWSPPLNIGMTNDLNGNPGDPDGNGLPPTGSSTCSYVTCDNCYALLISGGYNPENNHIRYWNDMSSMYKTLRQKYCYPEDHIYVLMSDGTSSDPDRRDVNPNTGAPVYDSSPLDLDGKDRAVDVHGEAIKTNIVETLTNRLELGQITSADTLFIFTTNHGGKDPSSSNVRLWLWQGDYIWDYEFANLLNNVQANTIAMTMEQCYSGGFVDDFTTSVPPGQTRVIATAARADEPSYGNDFSYQWISGMGGPADTEGKNDGLISLLEGFNYGQTHDTSFINGFEHPQYGPVTTPPSGATNALSSCSKIVCSQQPNPIPIVNQPGGFYPTPTDPDGDCIIFEDLNGDLTFNFLDVILFFNQMEWIAANEPVGAFDANRNGRIDFADIVNLYGRVP